MTNKKSMWVVTGHSESGDDYGPWVFTKKPTRTQLTKLVRELGNDGVDDDAPGYAGSYVHLKVTKVEA